MPPGSLSLSVFSATPEAGTEIAPQRRAAMVESSSGPLPWGRFAAAWEQAEESLARLDQMLRVSDLAEGWMNRAHFEEACATIWVEGGLVPLEDLVLLDANTPVKIPTQDLFRARAALLSRRSLARQKPAEALSAESILALQERRERMSSHPIAA